MTERHMMIPVSESLAIDLIRFSDGRLTPGSIGDMAEELILGMLERTAFDQFNGLFGERSFEFAEIYFSEIAAEWLKEDADARASRRKESRPLVWKEVTVPHGSEVRMQYGGKYHYAEIKNGRIVDESGSYSPSEWASTVAGGTSRNAWRDLWFKEPLSSSWVPAQLLRAQARERLSPLDISEL